MGLGCPLTRSLIDPQPRVRLDKARQLNRPLGEWKVTCHCWELYGLGGVRCSLSCLWLNGFRPQGTAGPTGAAQTARAVCIAGPAQRWGPGVSSSLSSLWSIRTSFVSPLHDVQACFCEVACTERGFALSLSLSLSFSLSASVCWVSCPTEPWPKTT